MGGLLPTSPLPPTRIANAAALACTLEVSAEKPGNITPTRDFADTTFADMVRAGLAIAPVMARAGEERVGSLVLRAVRAVRASQAPRGADPDGGTDAGRPGPGNPNLGIVLLFAPLARAAATRPPGESLRAGVRRVLEGLDVDDAADAFRAIALAMPGGLGEVPEHDVAQPARIDLRAAMRAAADRDAVAAEYADGYPVVLQHALPRLRAELDTGTPTLEAIVRLHVTLLAERPDTLIARKAGPDRARELSELAGEVRAGTRERGELDAALRGEGNRLNPGTTADLVAATLFAAGLEGIPLP